MFLLIKNKINKKVLIYFGFCLLLLSLIILYSKNFILLGGEGNYFINTLSTKGLYGFSWTSISGAMGWASPVINYPFVILDLFYWLQFFGLSLKVINTISVFLLYALPFLSMAWLLNNILKINFKISLLLSLFYILNPFSTYHLQGMMFFNAAPLFVLPLAFGILSKFYLDKFKLFFIFGITTSFLAFSFANTPYLGIFHIFLFISLIIIPYLKNLNFSFKIVFINLLITELSFVLFNAWWFINLIRFQVQEAAGYYTDQFAVDWAKAATNIGTIAKIFSLKTLIGQKQGDFFPDFYNSVPMSLLLFIPLFLLIWNFITEVNDKNKKAGRGNIIIFAFLLLIIFLNKGVNKPFEYIYVWMLTNIPFFLIFKSPLEKFSVLFVFLLTICLIPVIKKTWQYYLIILYLVACSIPFVTLNFMPDFKFEINKYISRKYLYKENYFKARETLNTDKLNYRILSLPGSPNYQVTVLNHDNNKYYRGMDPFVYSVNKPFVTAYSSSDRYSNLNSIFTNFSDTSITQALLNLYNVKKIVINKDIYPAFGFREKENVLQLMKIFSKNNNKQNFDSISIYTKKDFLPLFYTPEQNIITDEDIKTLGKITTEDNNQINYAIFFTKQNKNNNLASLEGVTVSDQTLEYKRINPTKYRIIIHNTRDKFSVIFNESFNNGWKMYPNAKTETVIKNQNLSNYKVLDGNADHQATKEELKKFIDQGLITDLGNGKEKEIRHLKWDSSANIWMGNEVLDYVEKYKVDFISKNFHGTIQNDNLPDGQVWETWLKKYIPDTNHLTANGYANSWLIDPNEVCILNINSQQQVNCIKNKDGSYDMELVVEFWPQRLFYIGLGIASFTTLICLLCLGYFYLKKKKDTRKL